MAARPSSGGLTGYLARQGREEQRRPDSPSPATPRNNNYRREAAARLKVDGRQIAAAKVPPPPLLSSKISSTAPAPGHVSNPSARNTFPGPQYNRQEMPPPVPYNPQEIPTPVQSRSRELLDDTTVDEDFDKTLSDAHFQQQMNGVEPVYLPEDVLHNDSEYPDTSYSGDEDEEEENGQHQQLRGGYQDPPFNQGQQYLEEYENRQATNLPPLHHKQSHSPLFNQPPQRQPTQPTGIVGRFNQQTMQMRPSQQGHNYSEKVQTSKKRSRSAELRPETRYDQNGHSFAAGRIDEDDEVRRERDVDQNEGLDELNGDGVRTPRARAGHDEELQGSSKPLNDNLQVQKSSQPVIDHPQPEKPPVVAHPEDQKLMGKSFAEVESDSWELSPPSPVASRGAAAAPLTLEDRLEDIVKRTEVGGDNDATMQFFMDMTSTDWEESGDWFVDRFSQIMQDMKNNRKKRRAITEKFESEIRAREEVVRGKSENLEKTFKDMQASGEGVLRGKV